MRVFLIIIYSLLSAMGMILIRIGSLNSEFILSQGNLNFTINLNLIIGFIVYMVTFIIWLIIMQKFNLSYISPIAYGIAFVMICFISYFLLGESISMVQYLGVTLIIIGVIIMSV
ncbi:putative Multidrug transporter EmrE [Clostridium neonatale]|uniref:hypothetical protein n=1 Tax=Clostridium neonatale TaxID=137838 RepID=UPI00291C1D0B|nr:hypothetical protein [Clostridium neonatale]CAI3633343.1 putative Multidrug transporter EmrE [Clostridium neonatale]